MLVLTRKDGESIQIGKDIRVTILRPRRGGRQVSVGIDAPKETKILRTELLEREQSRPR